MKAEHRKELETNALADHMGRWLKNIKSGPKSSRTSTVIWVSLLVILAGIVVVRYFSLAKYLNPFHWGKESNSALWVKLDQSNEKELQDFIDRNRGTVQARVAKFLIARPKLTKARCVLVNKPEDARKELQEASDLFEQLSRECTEEHLIQEALMGVGNAQEMLAVIDKEDQRPAHFSKALDFYRKLANGYPKSFLGADAAGDVERLQKPDVQAIYATLSKEANK